MKKGLGYHRKKCGLSFMHIPVLEDFSRQCERFGHGFATVCVSTTERDFYGSAPVRSFDAYVLSHIHRGEGRFFLPETRLECRIPAGYTVLVTPGTPHICGGVTEDYQEDYCIFGGEDFDRMTMSGLIKTGVYKSGVRRDLPMIADLLRLRTVEFHYQAFLKFQDMLLEIASGWQADQRYQQTLALLEEMTKDLSKNWSLEDMAAYCYCSTAQVRRNIVKYTGMLPKEYQENIKFDCAASWLSKGDMSIDDICFKLGFSDRFHFSRRFKEFYGQPPVKYRRQRSGELK